MMHIISCDKVRKFCKRTKIYIRVSIIHCSKFYSDKVALFKCKTENTAAPQVCSEIPSCSHCGTAFRAQIAHWVSESGDGRRRWRPMAMQRKKESSHQRLFSPPFLPAAKPTAQVMQFSLFFFFFFWTIPDLGS